MAAEKISISVSRQTLDLAIRALEFIGYSQHDLAIVQSTRRLGPEDVAELRTLAEANYSAARELKHAISPELKPVVGCVDQKLSEDANNQQRGRPTQEPQHELADLFCVFRLHQ